MMLSFFDTPACLSLAFPLRFFDTGNVSKKLVFTSVHPLSFFWIVTVADILSFADDFAQARNYIE
jgi:hypothetical protein